MSKMKTKRAAAKRFSFTARGKIKRNGAFHRHNFTNKPKQAKVRHRTIQYVDSADVRLVRRMLPYGS